MRSNTSVDNEMSIASRQRLRRTRGPTKLALEGNMAEMDDQELFSSAIADAPISEVADTPADAPATEAPQQDGPSRDEHGRFVSPRSEQAPEPVPQAGRQPEPGEA